MNEVVGKMNVQIYIIVSSLDGAEFLLFRVAPSIKFSSYKSHLNGVLILYNLWLKTQQDMLEKKKPKIGL